VAVAKRPVRPRARKPAADPAHPVPHDELYARILRFLRQSPNRVVELTPLAEELKMQPQALQVELERLGRRGFVVLPFIEPGTAGGAELAQGGLEWLIAYEGGKPKDVPVALQPAKGRVRAKDEAARLPRADVYGVGR
jgi:hypothetical protein